MSITYRTSRPLGDEVCFPSCSEKSVDITFFKFMIRVDAVRFLVFLFYQHLMENRGDCRKRGSKCGWSLFNHFGALERVQWIGRKYLAYLLHHTDNNASRKPLPNNSMAKAAVMTSCGPEGADSCRSGLKAFRLLYGTFNMRTSYQ